MNLNICAGQNLTLEYIRTFVGYLKYHKFCRLKTSGCTKGISASSICMLMTRKNRSLKGATVVIAGQLVDFIVLSFFRLSAASSLFHLFQVRVATPAVSLVNLLSSVLLSARFLVYLLFPALLVIEFCTPLPNALPEPVRYLK